MPTSTLRSDIAAWMNRTDLNAQIPSFIRIAESRIALDLRSWQMVQPITLTQTEGEASMALPVDWLEWDALAINDRPLSYVNADVMHSFIRAGRSNNSYTMVGDQLIVTGEIATGFPDVIVQATYYARIPPLVQDADTNWLLDTYPALYLYASLVSACQFVKDDGRAQGYAGAYTGLLNDINSIARKAPLSGSMWRQRAA